MDTPGTESNRANPSSRSERVVLRLGVFALVLAAVFGVGFGLGAALGPEPADTPPVVHEGDHGDQTDTGDEHEGMVHDD